MLNAQHKQKLHKVAVLLTLLGRETAQEIMRQFDAQTVERIGKEMLTCDEISKSEGEAVLREFLQALQRGDVLARGGAKFVQEVVSPVISSDRIEHLLAERKRTESPVLFESLREADPEKLITVLQGEHPQAIALVLANLPSDLGARILGQLSENKQAEVARRLAVLDKTQPDLEMAQEIERRLASRMDEEKKRGKLNKVGGIQTCADIFNQMDKQAVHRILQDLESKSAELASEIKMKMVRFEDLVKLDDLEVQRVLKEVETQDLATACNKAAKEVEDVIFRNMSQRGAEMLKDDIEVMRNIKADAIRAARLKIAETMRRLDEEGAITLNKETLNNELV